jgi:hypothetical protein
MELGAGAEVHVKGAFIQGSEHFVVKVVGGFPRRKHAGQAGTAGSVFVFDTASGELSGILRDNGLLTELRTAAVAAVAADVLARRRIDVVGVIGTGRPPATRFPHCLRCASLDASSYTGAVVSAPSSTLRRWGGSTDWTWRLARASRRSCAPPTFCSR